MYNADLHAPARWRLRAATIGTGALLTVGGMAIMWAPSAMAAPTAKPAPAPNTDTKTPPPPKDPKPAPAPKDDTKTPPPPKDPKPAPAPKPAKPPKDGKDTKGGSDQGGTTDGSGDNTGAGQTSNPGQDGGTPPGQIGNGGGTSTDGGSNGTDPGSNPGHGGTPPGQTGNGNGNGSGGVGQGNNAGGNGNGGVGQGNGNGNVQGSNPGHGGTPPGHNPGQPGNGNHGDGNNGKGHRNDPVTNVAFKGGKSVGPNSGPEAWQPFGSLDDTVPSPLSTLFFGEASALATSGSMSGAGLDGQTHVLGEKIVAPTPQLSASQVMNQFDKKSKARSPRMQAQPEKFTGTALTSGSWHNTGSAIPLLALLLLVEVLILVRRFGNRMRPAAIAASARNMPAQIRWA